MHNEAQDVFLVLKEADSIMIDSDAKVGKMTLASYLIKILFSQKTLIFTPQEPYLFNKKIKILAKQFEQFEEIDRYLTKYYLKDNWDTLKREYGYTYLLSEIEKIIVNSDEQLIVFHKLGDFFEFQDRYEIENFYKTLVKIVAKCNKKIIFLISNKNQNYKYIKNVSQEFSDVVIHMQKNEKNERFVNVTNIVTHQEYRPMVFSLYKKSFILKYPDDKESNTTRSQNILIMELDTNLAREHENMKNIYDYIFSTEDFIIHHANSFQSILHKIFIEPDVIIILMNNTIDNLSTIRAIKGQLPNTTIVSVIEKDFIRSEDAREAYRYGCDELFPRNYSFDTFILFLQKAISFPFYMDSLKMLNNKANILTSMQALEVLIDKCLEKHIFFTFFVVKKIKEFDGLTSGMRKLDFVYQCNGKIYYLALNTMLYTVDTILKRYLADYKDKDCLIASCTALDLEIIEENLRC